MSSTRMRSTRGALARQAAWALALGVTAACAGSPANAPIPRMGAAAISSTDRSTATSAGQLVTVPLALGGAGQNPGPRIAVSLSEGQSTMILMDSGSTGLRLLPSAMRALPINSYDETNVKIAKSFANGHVYYGSLGVAETGVTIGGKLRIARPLEFQIVTTVCDGNVPSPLPSVPPANCNNTTSNAEAETGGGVIGVRPELFDNLRNPLAELPPPLDDGFVISLASHSLTAGATAANQSGFSTVPVPSATATDDGSPYWPNEALLPWCYAITVDGSSVADCPSAPTLTDTGAGDETLSLSIAPPTGVVPDVEQTLPPHSAVTATLTQPGAASPSITWTLETGACSPLNAPNFVFDRSTSTPSPSVHPNTNGLTPFFYNDVLYDLKKGFFGFRAVKAKPYSNCS